jgi:hypothetical protein
MPSLPSISAEWRIVSQSDLLPMIMPTTGALEEVISDGRWLAVRDFLKLALKVWGAL